MECYEFDNHKSGNEKRFLLIYDISNTKRRNKISKLMEGYGKRVQESAFECNVSKRKYNALLNKIPKLITSEDNIRIYPIYDSENIITWNISIELINPDLIIC